MRTFEHEQSGNGYSENNHQPFVRHRVLPTPDASRSRPTSIKSEPPAVPPKSPHILKKLQEHRQQMQRQQFFGESVQPELLNNESAVFRAKPAITVVTSKAQSEASPLSNTSTASSFDAASTPLASEESANVLPPLPPHASPNRGFKKIDLKGPLTDKSLTAYLQQNFEAGVYWVGS